MSTLTALVAIAFLQLWLNEGGAQSEDFFKAAKFLTKLRTEEDEPLGDCTSDHMISTNATDLGRTIATVDRKGMEFTCYHYHHRHCLDAMADTKDLFIDLVVERGVPLCSVVEEVKGGKGGDGGWQGAVLHLLGQILATQGNASTSGFSSFTSVYAFNRISLTSHSTRELFITENLTRGQNAHPGVDEFMRLMFTFLVAAVAKTEPTTLPLSKRLLYGQLFVPEASGPMHSAQASSASIRIRSITVKLRTALLSICLAFIGICCLIFQCPLVGAQSRGVTDAVGSGHLKYLWSLGRITAAAALPPVPRRGWFSKWMSDMFLVILEPFESSGCFVNQS
ncbi:unnamed protein product [Cyclocybe aegerita]|uniref:Uncharacterized protein n=1 Tax=Cyclocybe aegerita TaxID=1973307 RepID=A0A8S0XXB6_CYCAE|nr:unnamed protein product [Cyclocybe aegerita]